MKKEPRTEFNLCRSLCTSVAPFEVSASLWLYLPEAFFTVVTQKDYQPLSYVNALWPSLLEIKSQFYFITDVNRR